MNPAKASTPIVILMSGMVLIAGMMLCVSFASSVVVSVQAKDLTVMVREAELTATGDARRATAAAQAAATAAQRRIELEQLHDAQTRTALEITVSAATAQYEVGQTQTPIAQTAVAGRAMATGQAIANATSAAQATGTAQATATQIAGTATAAPMQTAEALAVQATVAAQDALNRQVVINQVAQVVRVGLCAMVIVIVIVMMRHVWRMRPTKPVVIVENAEPAPIPAADFAAEGANIYTDPRASMYVMDLLRQDKSYEQHVTQT